MESLVKKLTLLSEELRETFASAEHLEKIALEIDVLESFTAAIENGENILENGEPVDIVDDDENVCYTFEEIEKQVKERLENVTSGNNVDDAHHTFPFSDDACHIPTCNCDHVYDDEHFSEHCDDCGAWLCENTPISILWNKETKDELCVCTECIEGFLEKGYTDDMGDLQVARLEENDGETLHLILLHSFERSKILSNHQQLIDFHLCLLSTRNAPTITSSPLKVFNARFPDLVGFTIESFLLKLPKDIKTPIEFFHRREEYADLYKSTMNSCATDFKCGSRDNFDFFEEYGTCEELGNGVGIHERG